MKLSVVRARIEEDLKAQAAGVLASCGLELSDAIRLFLRQVVAKGGLPFQVRDPARIRRVHPRRLDAMKQQAQMRDLAIAISQNPSSEQIFLIRPREARKAKIKWPSVALGG